MNTETTELTQTTAMSQTALMSLRGISKSYSKKPANDNIDLDVYSGEVHALLGENGAGKSTLVKMIYGIVQPDAGSLMWKGEPVTISNPAKARELGIGMVFQHFSLFESMSVADNIRLGLPSHLIGEDFLERIVRISNDYGLQLDPSRRIYQLSVGEKQRVEIVRSLLQKPKLLIMDEPTSVLTPQEAIRLFATLRQLAKNGCAILYISHRLSEIRSLCHKATIMRRGRVVSSCDPSEKSASSLAEMMMGDSVKVAVRPEIQAGEVIFRAQSLRSQRQS